MKLERYATPAFGGFAVITAIALSGCAAAASTSAPSHASTTTMTSAPAQSASGEIAPRIGKSQRTATGGAGLVDDAEGPLLPKQDEADAPTRRDDRRPNGTGLTGWKK